ncbi:hypothetical protein RB653_006610 [Dictyostelium firmibasis]|uniref:Transmembrane protein n=1 Tax=Dictyostelium firmibasis TaxID=79012 RepID=A0AAN7TKH8_9MYCE
MQKLKVFNFFFSFIMILSIIVLALSFSQIDNKFKGQSYGSIDITQSYVDTICLQSEAVPYTQTFLFYATEWQKVNSSDSSSLDSSSNSTNAPKNSTDSLTPTTNGGWKNVIVGVEEGFVQCAWRNKNSTLRVMVHFFSIFLCVIALILIKKQKLSVFLISSYAMTIVGIIGIYSGIVDSIGVKKAYDFCMTLSPFYSSDCYYKAFNCTIALDFLSSVLLFLCAVLSSRFRISLFNESAVVNNNSNNNNSNTARNTNIDVENGASSQNNIELKSKSKNKNSNHSILEDEVDFENNGTILTTNDQYITSNNDRDL